MRMTRPPGGIWVVVAYVTGILVVLAILAWIAYGR
jgi:hypothetical protein